MTNLVLLGTYCVMAFCPCRKCCQAQNGVCANGHIPTQGYTVGDTRKFPFGTRLWIEGIGWRTVEDRMAKRHRGNKLDVYYRKHQDAKQHGVQQLKVWQQK